MEKVWNAWGAAQQLQEVLNQQIQKKLDEATITDPYYPHDSLGIVELGLQQHLRI